MHLLLLKHKWRRITTLNSTTCNDNKFIRADVQIANDFTECIPYKKFSNNTILSYTVQCETKSFTYHMHWHTHTLRKERKHRANTNAYKWSGHRFKPITVNGQWIGYDLIRLKWQTYAVQPFTCAWQSCLQWVCVCISRAIRNVSWCLDFCPVEMH